jgi:putative oxidoreductase
MMKKFFSAHGLWHDAGLGIIRILVGLMISYHGLEVFDQAKMADYGKWMTDLKLPAPLFMAYLGKGVEFFCGVLFTIGLFTRLACIPLILTMAFIPFVLGHGKVFTDDQHPFLFVVIFLIYFFTGPGRWSLDYAVFNKKSSNQ